MKQPLEGIVVLDLTRHLSGPFGTMILRDLGARVLKFEPAAGDPARKAGPFQDGDSAYFHPINRGKESVQIDLRDPTDVAHLRCLLTDADCLVENFRPGVMGDMGLGPEEVLKENPHLIYASLSGFGATGPYARRPAFDVVVQAMGGLMSVTGNDNGPPTRVGVSQADIVAGIYMALGIMAALVRRDRTGAGAYLDVSMLEAQMCLGTHAFGIREATGTDPQRIGNRHPTVAPFDAYPTSDGYVAIAVVDDAAFGRLSEALGCPQLSTDPRFADRDSRLANVAQLTEEITALTQDLSTDTLVKRLVEASVSCGPVQGIGSVLNDPQVQARGSVVNVESWGSRGLRVPRLPFLFDGEPCAQVQRAPDLASTSLESLLEEFGYVEPRKNIV